MNQHDTLEVARIRQEYTEKNTQKLDELKALDRKVKLPAEIFAYTFGTVGSLVLGAGMSMAMGVIGSGLMIPGIVVGCLGIVAVSVNYFIRNKILSSRKKKYAEQIMTLSDEILNAQ
ncbi:MAG: dihydropteridine reductase [Clostridia bacterium]|nr:dihydropteridine reductase [Clostridia bacterium]MBR2295816.1 dihydropteridine reductase [Clostridia bacterium]